MPWPTMTLCPHPNASPFTSSRPLFLLPIQAVLGNRAKSSQRGYAPNTFRDVGRAKGVPLAAHFADERLAFVDTLPPGMPSSMQVDLERGNRLELPWLSGTVVDLGRKLGVATPANSRIGKELAPFADGKH